jgi:uncharacterized protein (TIRG00374 family)
LSETHFLRRHAGKLIASAIITTYFVYWLQSVGIKIWPGKDAFAHVPGWTIAVYALSYAGLSYFRAVRWRFLLRAMVDVPKRRLLAVSWIGFAAVLILPFRIGEFVRPYMLRSPAREAPDGKKTPEISMSMATGSVVAERVTDLFYLSLVLAVALLAVPTLDPLPETVVGAKIRVVDVRYYGFTMLGISIVAFAVMTIFYFARAWAHRTTLRVFGMISKPLGEKLAGIAERLADGLHFLGRPRDALPFLLETSAYWGINVLGMWFLAWACGLTHAGGRPATFGESCAMMGMLGVTILIPGTPGLLGVFQLGIYAGMTMYYPLEVVTGPGAAYVSLLYGVQVACTVVLGAAGFIIERGSLKALEVAEESMEEDEAKA